MEKIRKLTEDVYTESVLKGHACSVRSEGSGCLNGFKIAALTAFFLASGLLLVVVINYNTNSVKTRVGGLVLVPQHKPATISASITGTNVPIVNAILPLYGFFRGVQVCGEIWASFTRKRYPEGWNQNLTFKQELIESKLRAGLSAGADFLAMTVSVFNVLAQYFLVLLLAITSDTDRDSHEIATGGFVVFYLVYGFIDMIDKARYYVRDPRYSIHFTIIIVRSVLWVAQSIIAGIFCSVFSDNDQQPLVARLEYGLSACILVHGLLGAWFTQDVHIGVIFKVFFPKPSQKYDSLSPTARGYTHIQQRSFPSTPSVSRGRMHDWQ